MKKKNYMPKTPKEKGLFVGAIICIVVFIPSLVFIVEGISIIPFLIIALLAIGGAMAFALYARKIIDARLKEEEANEEQPKAEEPVKQEAPAPKPVVKEEAIPEPAPVEEVVEPEPVIVPEPVEAVNESKPVEEPVFEEEPTPVLPAEKKKSSKAVLAVVIPVVAVALVAAVAIPVAIHFANNNNNTEIRDDDGGNNNNNNNNNGGNKVSFNITSTVRYEEVVHEQRIDGCQFEPNKNFILYRFELSDAGWYVDWIDYGKWSFDASTGFISAVCDRYDTWDIYDKWATHTYSENASNAQKSYKVVNSTTLYWNGNSQFVLKKVNNFTHPINIFQEKPY